MLSLLNQATRGRFPLALAAAMACALVAFSGAAVAQGDDDDLTFEQRLIRGLLGGGSNKNLDYRERSPLVIPPSRELPPPDTGAALQSSPAWPNDPDRRRPANVSNRFFGADEAERAGSRRSTPDEMRRGTVRGAGRNTTPANTTSDNEASRPLRLNEMGGKNYSLFGIFTRQATAEAEPFKEEPVRSRMTEPPAGYRTPAPTQPYAPPKDSGSSWFKLPDPFARGTDR